MFMSSITTKYKAVKIGKKKSNRKKNVHNNYYYCNISLIVLKSGQHRENIPVCRSVTPVQSHLLFHPNSCR